MNVSSASHTARVPVILTIDVVFFPLQRNYNPILKAKAVTATFCKVHRIFTNQAEPNPDEIVSTPPHPLGANFKLFHC